MARHFQLDMTFASLRFQGTEVLKSLKCQGDSGCSIWTARLLLNTMSLDFIRFSQNLNNALNVKTPNKFISLDIHIHIQYEMSIKMICSLFSQRLTRKKVNRCNIKMQCRRHSPASLFVDIFPVVSVSVCSHRLSHRWLRQLSS